MNYTFGVQGKPDDCTYYLTTDPVKLNTVTLGAKSYVNSSRLYMFADNNPNDVLVGRYSAISFDISMVIAGNHAYKNSVSTSAPVAPLRFGYRHSENRHQIIIGHDVWIGVGATIMGGVRIGNGAIIGTNAMVTKNVPPYAIVVGNPMRIIRYRFDAEAIRKLLAIKWWNWSSDKISAAAPDFYEPDKFIAENYVDGMELAPYDEMGGGYRIEQHRAEGRKVYAFVADFRAAQPLWKRVVSGFLKSQEKMSVLIIWTGEEFAQAALDTLQQFVKSIEPACRKLIHVKAQKFSPYLLRNSTHFIATREMVTLECLDWLYGTDVKIVSALDDGIFEGEPEVPWSELYAIS